jgi:hypothetical protein
MNETRRVAVRVDGDPVPSFVAGAIEQVAATPGVELVAVIVDRSGAAGGAPLSARWYDAVERRVFRGGAPAVATVPLRGRLAGTLRVAHRPDETWTLARDEHADVLLDLAARPLVATPAPDQGPAHGTWTLGYAAGIDGRREPRPARRAAADGLGVVTLVATFGDGRVVELARHVGALPAVPFVRNRDALLWASANLPARALRQGAPTTVREPDRWAPPDARAHVAATRATRPGWVRLIGATARRVAERAWYRETWEVLSRPAEPAAGPPRDLRGFEPVPAPAGRFFADPFLVEDAGSVRLFVEVSRVGRHEGSIAALARRSDGRWGPAEPVLDVGRHLAYPHLTTVAGELLLTPDDGSLGAVVAYRADETGRAWQPVATILEGVRATDPTLLEHAGRLWLFVTQTTPGMSPWDELHLYSAVSIDGPWEPHPGNPIVADVRRARSAGCVFRLGDRLVRPAQDCARAYGRRVVLNEITCLERERYAERAIGSIEPEGLPGARRTHSYAAAGGVQAVDAFVRRPRLILRGSVRRSEGAPAVARS